MSYNFGLEKHFKRVLEQEQCRQSASAPAVSPQPPPNTHKVALGDSSALPPAQQPSCPVLGLTAAVVGAQRGGHSDRHTQTQEGLAPSSGLWQPWCGSRTRAVPITCAGTAEASPGILGSVLGSSCQEGPLGAGACPEKGANLEKG